MQTYILLPNPSWFNNYCPHLPTRRHQGSHPEHGSEDTGGSLAHPRLFQGVQLQTANLHGWITDWWGSTDLTERHSSALDAEHRECHHPVHGWSCIGSEVRAKPSLKLASKESTFMAHVQVGRKTNTAQLPSVHLMPMPSLLRSLSVGGNGRGGGNNHGPCWALLQACRGGACGVARGGWHCSGPCSTRPAAE